MNQLGAEIPYPYNVPNKTQPDGTPGILTLIGAAEAIQEEMDDEADTTGNTKNKKEVDCGKKREDEK